MLREIVENQVLESQKFPSNIYGFRIDVRAIYSGEEYVNWQDLEDAIGDALKKSVPKVFGKGQILTEGVCGWRGCRPDTMKSGSKFLDYQYHWVSDPYEFSNLGGDIIRDNKDQLATLDDDIDKKTVAKYAKLAKKGFKVTDKPSGTIFKFKVFPYVMDYGKQHGLKDRANNYNNSW